METIFLSQLIYGDKEKGDAHDEMGDSDTARNLYAN